MPMFKIRASAKKIGAIGIPSLIQDEIEAPTPEEAERLFRAKWYETHEHIHIALPNWNGRDLM